MDKRDSFLVHFHKGHDFDFSYHMVEVCQRMNVIYGSAVTNTNLIQYEYIVVEEYYFRIMFEE